MSKLKKYNPDHIVKSFAAYSQGVEVPPNARWLFIAGQLGVNLDGKVAGGSKAQVERAWQNVLALLADADVHRAYAGIALPNEPSLALHAAFDFVEVSRFTEVGRKFDRYWDVAWLKRIAFGVLLVMGIWILATAV